MKAILIVDLGNADSDCYFIDYVVRRKDTGVALESGYNVNLKSMPSQKYISLKDEHDDIIFQMGWNACIDAILGEEE